MCRRKMDGHPDKKSRKRPTALAGNRANGGLVSRVDVGTFIAIHFHGNEKFIDQRSDRRIFVAFAIHHVAPVAPDRADVTKSVYFRQQRAQMRLLPIRTTQPADAQRSGNTGRSNRQGGFFCSDTISLGSSRDTGKLDADAWVRHESVLP